MGILRCIFGLVSLIGIAYLLSSNRKRIDWKLVATGSLLHIVVGLLITQVTWVQAGFGLISSGFVRIINFSAEGAQFLFGGLAINSFESPEAHHNLGVIFAFQVLPSIIFFSSLSAGLYYLGILQIIVKGIAWVMSKTMGLTGAESLSVAGNIFLGQTEAPLLVKPFIKNMTNSELSCLMTGGMATIAGAVLASFVKFLSHGDPATETLIATRLLSASLLNAPAAIVFAKILLPETEKVSSKKLNVTEEGFGVNLIDALATGAIEGLKLALNVGAMLLAFISLIALLNFMLEDLVGQRLNWGDSTLNDSWIQVENATFLRL